MAFNGSGTFNLYTPGTPFVTGTTISSTVMNAVQTDIASGLSNTICKDGQTTTTGTIPFATAVTMASTLSVTGAVTLTGNASVGGTLAVTGAATLSSTLAVTGVATFTEKPILSSLTASQAVFSDGSKGLVSNAITGTGNVVMSASPTLTGTANFAAIAATGDIQQNNATYLRGKNFADTSTRMLGISAADILFIGSIDAALSGGIAFNINGTQLGTWSPTGALGVASNITMTAANPSLVGGTTAGSVTMQNVAADSYITVYGGTHATKANKTEFVNGSTVSATLSSAGLSLPGTLGVTGVITASNLTASRGILTDASKSLISAEAPVTNSLGADVTLNNTGNYFDGPSAANGTSGTWFASGTVTLFASAASNIYLKLWDGTTLIASTNVYIPDASANVSASLSGYITGPVGNLRISARDPSRTDSKIIFNATGNSKDSTISAIRVA